MNSFASRRSPWVGQCIVCLCVAIVGLLVYRGSSGITQGGTHHHTIKFQKHAASEGAEHASPQHTPVGERGEAVAAVEEASEAYRHSNQARALEDGSSVEEAGLGAAKSGTPEQRGDAVEDAAPAAGGASGGETAASGAPSEEKDSGTGKSRYSHPDEEEQASWRKRVEEFKRARHEARLHPELAGDIDELWLNVHDVRHNKEWWAANPRTEHDAATAALIKDLGRCATMRCASQKAKRLLGLTRFNFPHYFIIGWQKCATTSVNAYLRKHPQTLFGRVKETHWFTSCQGNRDQCRADNETHYLRDSLRIEAATAGGLDQATLDASADYARNGVKLAPELFELFPWLKIVVMLREPISRTISYTRMHTEQQHGMKGCLPDEPLYECLMRFMAPGVRKRHVYSRHLEAWLSAFPRGQVHVIQMEAMQDQPEPTLHTLKEFLGMDVAVPEWDIRNVNSRHARRGQPMERQEYEQLAQLARNDAIRVARVLDHYGAGDGAAFVARWEKVWQGVLDACEGDQCYVDSN